MHVLREYCLGDVRGDELRHLEHRHFALTEDSLQLLIREDVALVGWILKVVLLDVDPKLFDYFGSGHRAGTHNRLQFRGKGKRLR